MLKTFSLPREALFSFLVLLVLGLTGIGILSGRQADASAPALADGAHASRQLVVAAPKNERFTATLSPFGPGFEAELLGAFCERYGYTLRKKLVDGPEEAYRELTRGKADLAVALVSDVPETLNGPLAAGPAYAFASPLLVYGKSLPSSKKRAALKALRENREACLAAQPEAASAGEDLAASLAAAQVETLGESGESACGEGLRREDELYPVLAELASTPARQESEAVLVDGGRFQLWQPFFASVEATRAGGDEVPLRWFWRTENPGLAEDLATFWQDKETEALLARLTERYFGFLPDAPEELDVYEVGHLSRMVKERLPGYAERIRVEATANSLDPLFLAAVIYQESRFDVSAVSSTGVRGLMQITRETADFLNIRDRKDPDESIRGGASYLRMLFEKFDGYAADAWDQWCFALAAYNQGPGHVYDAIKLARRMGGTGRTWAELREALPKLAYQTYASQAKHGYCRGGEAVAYVDKVRYFYYVLHGFVALSRPEAQYLGPLRAGLGPA